MVDTAPKRFGNVHHSGQMFQVRHTCPKNGSFRIPYFFQDQPMREILYFFIRLYRVVRPMPEIRQASLMEPRV